MAVLKKCLHFTTRAMPPTRATPPTRETRVTRLAGKVKILLLFWILPQIFVQFTTRATLVPPYCFTPHGVKKLSVTQ